MSLPGQMTGYSVESATRRTVQRIRRPVQMEPVASKTKVYKTAIVTNQPPIRRQVSVSQPACHRLRRHNDAFRALLTAAIGGPGKRFDGFAEPWHSGAP